MKDTQSLITMNSQPLTKILRCPVTKHDLEWMPAKSIEDLNSAIDADQVRHMSGDRVGFQVVNALRSSDRRFIYPIQDQIITLLPTLAIVEKKECANTSSCLSEEKSILKRFYDDFGWKLKEDNVYEDTALYNDPSPIAKSYRSRCHRRLKRYLPKTGTYLLDAASGAIPHPEYLEYSDDFDFRICVDLSYRGLQEAKAKLGDKGIYLFADVTNLPIRNDSIDAAISLHTIFHVPKDEQLTALRELRRVIKPNAPAVVVYSWGNRSLLMNMADRLYKGALFSPRLLARAFRRLTRILGAKPKEIINKPAKPNPPPIYFYTFDYHYFADPELRLDIKFFVWSCVNNRFMTRFARGPLIGPCLLSIIYYLENLFPRTLARIGEYPIFLIRKKGAEAAGP